MLRIVNLAEPPAWHIPGNELDLREKRAELTHGMLKVFGQRLQRMPRDIARRTPLPGYRFFVERAQVLGPGFGTGVQQIAHAEHLCRVKLRTARGKAAGVGDRLGDDAIRADIDVIESKATLARRGFYTPFRGGLHPSQVEFPIA